jgi:hypothetical protein
VVIADRRQALAVGREAQAGDAVLVPFEDPGFPLGGQVEEVNARSAAFRPGDDLAVRRKSDRLAKRILRSPLANEALGFQVVDAHTLVGRRDGEEPAVVRDGEGRRLIGERYGERDFPAGSGFPGAEDIVAQGEEGLAAIEEGEARDATTLAQAQAAEPSHSGGREEIALGVLARRRRGRRGIRAARRLPARGEEKSGSQKDQSASTRHGSLREQHQGMDGVNPLKLVARWAPDQGEYGVDQWARSPTRHRDPRRDSRGRR